ncbi:MAG: phosphatidylserine/phosphatidylglycerophosphate/cardiolipin synthase family protein [Halobacteriales archaeon]
MRVAWLVVLLALTVPAAAAGQSPSPTPTPANGAPAGPDAPRLVAVYPNPTFPGDRGEFVVVRVPANTPLGTLALADGETTVGLPDRELAGRVAVATDPVVATLTDAPVVLVPGPLRLANRGEQLVLLGGDGVVDRVSYADAPEGLLYRRTPTGWTWRAPGATSFPVRSGRASSARLFVLPDAPAAVLAPLRDADRRLWLAGYTFTSRRVADVLCAARSRGVDVRVLVELEPVSGMTTVGARRLDRLAGCGVTVRAIGGPRARYAFHHAKYAVVDDRAVVLTENWKPAGVGGRSSRGWGVVLTSPAVADALAETFAADAGWRDARPWRIARRDRRFVPANSPANGTFPAAFTPVAVEDVGVEVVVAPDNAERRTVALLDGARTSIRVIQVSVGGERQPFVRALLRAARRGVSVKLLLAGVWYVREDNRAVAQALNELAREEGLPLDVRLAAPHGRYGKIHAKAAVVDGEHVLLGSLNWNNASARRNREVDVVLHSPAAARYYGRVFDADWQGGRWRVPAGLVVVAAALALAAAGFAARRIEFDPGGDEGVVPAPDGPASGPPGPGLP